MAKYELRIDCEVAGRWHTTGETLELPLSAAKHLTPPYGNVLMPVADPAKPLPVTGRKPTAKTDSEDG